MASDGWIKLHRCLQDSLVWKSSSSIQRDVLINLLLLASHTRNDWSWKGARYTVEPGQFITSLESIQSNCAKGVSLQNIRTALLKFEKFGFLTSESTNRGRLITIENWAVYQGDDKKANRQTNKHLTSDQQLSIMKEGKKIFIPPSIADVESYANERSRPDLAKRFFDYYDNATPPWTDNKGAPIRSWKQKFITWEKTNPPPQTPKTREYLP